MTALVAVATGVLGLALGVGVATAASRFPWETAAQQPVHVRTPRPVIVLATGLLCALAGLRFGLSWQLPAFLFLAVAGVLLAVVDLAHRLLPNRVLVPSFGIGVVLLAVGAAAGSDWAGLVRAVAGAGVLFAVFLVLALVSPGGLGMGDVKLAALLGLYLGSLGWGAVLLGAVAGFVVQAVLAMTLLAGRRIGLRGELPFGPAMLAGAALAIGWAPAVLDAYVGHI